MPAIVTNDLRIKNSDTFAADLISTPNYIYIGRDTPWPNETFPPALTGTDKDIFEVYNDLLAMKKIDSTDIQSVCQRIDWKSGTRYDQYDHRVNMLGKDIVSKNYYNFYVVTEEFNVYKCISNNQGAFSIERPTSQQIGTFQTSDGYIWKYMYTLRATDTINFLTTNWMPIYTLKYNDGSAQWQVQSTAIDGAIHRIQLDNPGANYNPAILPTVEIVGDGTGASATLQINENDGSIARIIVVDVGSGYSYATATLTNTGDGIGAVLTPILSPVGGHGFDARAELGGASKMIKSTITGDEGGVFPTTSFRKTGIISAPLSTHSGSKVTLNSNSGFSPGDSLQGGTSNAIGQVLYVDGPIIWIQNVVGNFVVGEAMNNLTTSGYSNVVTVINGTKIPLLQSVASKDDIINRTGKILYMSNREKITRASEQSENIRVLIEF